MLDISTKSVYIHEHIYIYIHRFPVLFTQFTQDISTGILVSKGEVAHRRDQGYEPKYPPVTSTSAMERSSSEPPKLQTGLGVVNPFYSERNKTEIALRASRPSALPEQSPEEDALPLLGEQSAGVCTGKGRGGQASGKLNVFETPPPSRMEAFGGDENGPKRTQGTMPVDDVATTWVPTAMGRKAP